MSAVGAVSAARAAGAVTTASGENDVGGGALLSVRGLTKHFPVQSGLGRRKGLIHAVDAVSFDILAGETLGLVGESGSGKSTIARLILRLYGATAGSVVFGGEDLMQLRADRMRSVRRDMQVIFQDPFASLDPRMRLYDIVAEPLVTHFQESREQTAQRVSDMLKVVGLKPYQMRQYPHQLSGGQRQRVGIARALAINPKLVLCDEPVSALDVSIQAQILNLLKDLQEEFNLTYLFISHDLHVVRYMSDRICVLYLGKVVEQGPTEQVFLNPGHPYTASLVSVAPLADPTLRNRERVILEGELPSSLNPPSGCRFRTRCPRAFAVCSEHEPPVVQVGEGHQVACHLYRM